MFLSSLQLSSKRIVTNEELEQKWKGLCLPVEQLNTILTLGNFETEADWMHFFALCCSALGGVSNEALIYYIYTSHAIVSLHFYKTIFTS